MEAHPVIDSHCHLFLLKEKFPSLKKDLSLLQDQGLLLLDVGLEPQDIWKRKEEFASFSKIFFSAGLHPNYCKLYSEQSLRENLKETIPHASAIGECGLDWYHMNSDKETQKRMFTIHLEAAATYHKPLIIHARDSLSDLIAHVKEFKEDVIAVQHCFSGNEKELDQCLELGFYVSFTANISYKKNTELLKLASTVPEDRLLLETDAPFLSHQSIRGSTNHPKHIPLLYQSLAEAKNCPVDFLYKIVEQNLLRMLNIENAL